MGDIFRGALRLVRRHPSTLLGIVGSLTLGLALVTSVVSLFDHVFLSPWDVQDADALMVVHTTRQDGSGEPRGPFKWSYPDYLDMGQSASTLGETAIFQYWPMSIDTGDEPFRGRGMFVSTNYFSVLGLAASHGRLLGAADRGLDEVAAVVLSHRAWRRHFAADPGVVGRSLRVNGQSMTVVGVGPAGFHGIEVPVEIDLWLPVERYGQVGPFPEWFEVRGTSFFTALTRRQSATSPQQTKDRWAAFASGLREEHPKAAEGLGVDLRPLIEASFAPSERQRHLSYGEALLTGGLLILFVCAVNAAHLLWGLALARRRELSIRSAVGASRRRLLTQSMGEIGLLGIVAGLLAWPVAWGMLRCLSLLRPPQFPREIFTRALDGQIFAAFWLAMVLGVALMAGLSVGWQRRLRGALRGQPAATTTERSRGTSLWVALQVALAAVALVASLLFLRALERAYDVHLGFDSERLLVVSLAPGESAWDEVRSRELYRRAAEQVEEIAEVSGVAWSENRLLRGATWQRSIYLEGATEPLVVGQRAVHRTNVVSPAFFEVAGISRLSGRSFRQDGEGDGPLTVIVNRTFAETAWPGEAAEGRRFRFDDATTGDLLQVVGVVADAKYRHVEEAAQGFVYLPMSQHFRPAMTLHVRSDLPPESLIPSVRDTLRRLAPSLPLADFDTLTTFVDEDLWLDRVSAVSLSSFAGLSWLLAALGVYGVLAQVVSRQRREIGVRRSLGASGWQLGKTLLGSVSTALGLGLLLGALMSFLLLRSAMAVDRRWLDLLDLPGLLLLLLILLAAAALGFWAPYRRARGIDPIHLLRDD